MVMSQTEEIDRSVTKDTEDVQTTEETDEVPSWSEIFGRSSDIGLKKSVGAYSAVAGALFLGSMFLLPVTIGFTISLFLVTFLTGLVGKSDLVGAGATGLIGGGVTSVITAGLAALTIMPVLTGAATGMIAGVVGVLLGGFIRDKIGN